MLQLTIVISKQVGGTERCHSPVLGVNITVLNEKHIASYQMITCRVSKEKHQQSRIGCTILDPFSRIETFVKKAVSAL